MTRDAQRPPASTPLLKTQRDVESLCERIMAASQVGFDTEFVSEDTFYPELCLIQVVVGTEAFVVDPQLVDVRGLWQVLVEGDHTTVVHAGREELNFLLRSTGKLPRRLFDVQIAAGFCSNEYPAAYASLASRFLNVKPLKGEQRTDWRRRPLSEAQIRYAAEDVRYLFPLFERMTKLLTDRGRLSWYETEIRRWQDDVVQAQDRQDWRRVSGIGSLSAKSMGVVRELWLWRQAEAKRLNQPAKRLLRDDLLVEIAKRKIDEPDQILAIRGLQRSDLRRKVRELADCVRRGVEDPVQRGGRGPVGEPPSQLALLGQFLLPALTTICRRAEVAASMVGTATDVRELISYRFDFDGVDPDETPLLLRGWRAELVGNLLDDLLAGKRSIRIVDPQHEDPLAFDSVNGSA